MLESSSASNNVSHVLYGAAGKVGGSRSSARILPLNKAQNNVVCKRRDLLDYELSITSCGYDTWHGLLQNVITEAEAVGANLICDCSRHFSCLLVKATTLGGLAGLSTVIR